MAVVYSYIRFSTKKQILGDSLRRQKEMGEEWIARNGHTQADLTLHDLGVSAFRGKNKHEGALKEFLDAIESGRVSPGSFLLVENLDRLSREGVNKAYTLFTSILSAGVNIVVLRPFEQVYSKESQNDLVELLMPLMSFYLAFLESKNKSDRLRKSWQQKRKEAPEGVPFDGRCPSWIQRNKKSQCFEKKAGWEAIKFIFQRTVEGVGQTRVLSELQEKGFEPLGTSGRWNGSFIQKVLSERTVLGERQPFTTNEEGQRVPEGDPIPGYYPAVIDEGLWLQAQAAKAGRAKQKGPNSTFINLFKGLLFNANDGEKMHVQSSPSGSSERQRRLVSYGHKSKKAGSCPISVEYFDLERAVLKYLTELSPKDLAPKVTDSDLVAKRQELEGVNVRLNQLSSSLSNMDIPFSPTMVKSIETLEARKVRLKEVIESLQQKRQSDPLFETQSLLTMLDNTKPDNRHALRGKLSMHIGNLIESIWIEPQKHKGRVASVVQLNFADGGHKFVWCGGGDSTGYDFDHKLSPPLPAHDLRNPDRLRFSLAGSGLADEPESIPTTIPDRLEPASDIWLKVAKNRMSSNAYRVVPSKIRRFVEFIGPQARCTSLNKRKWSAWTRWLKDEIKSGELAVATARVNYSRARELIYWLVQEDKTELWEGLDLAPAKIFPMPK